MKICIISGVPQAYAPKRLMEEGKKRGHEMTLIHWNELCLKIEKGSIDFFSGDISLDKFDAIIPRSDNFEIRIEGKLFKRDADTLSRLLVEFAKRYDIFYLNSGYFQKYQSLDKLAQQFFFAQNGLPGINTYCATDKEFNRYNLPVVAKIAKGSKGIGVYKFETKDEVNGFIEKQEKANRNFLLQDFMPITHDLRVLMVGGKVLGVMKRMPGNDKEWKTNVSLGGLVERFESDAEIVALSKKIAEKMDLEYVGIDLLKSDNKYYIIETNSLAQFAGFEKIFPEVNVAGELIDYIEKQVSRK